MAKFDPRGKGFDTKSSRASGAKRGAQGHLPSRDPRTGQVLKGLKHSTFDRAIRADAKAGFKPFVDRGTGRVHTFKGGNPDAKRFQSVDADRLIKESARQRRDKGR